MPASLRSILRRLRSGDRPLPGEASVLPSSNLHPAKTFDAVVAAVRDYAIILLDREGSIVSWNTGAERLTGYRPEEIVGRHFSILYPEDGVKRGAPADELAMATSTGRFEDTSWRQRKDGSLFWANVVLTALRDPSGTVHGFVKITRDLTERKQAEESLRGSEERFRLLVEGVRDYAIFMLDSRGQVITWNVGAQRIYGYQPKDIIRRHFSVFYEADAIRKEWPQHELRVATEQGRFEDEGWRVRQDGSAFWGNVIITAVRDAKGRIQGFSKVTRDLTEKRRAEESLEHRVRERTAELTRMTEAQTTFLAMLGHELRNPLAPMRNALQILQTPDVPRQAAGQATRIIDRQLEHMIRLVNDLLDVSRIVQDRIEMKQETMDLKDSIQRALETARPAIDAQRHRLELKLTPDPVPIQGDLVRLAQVFSNLLLNSAKFMDPGGMIAVSAERANGQAIVRVRDAGVGIERGMLGQVFDLFTQARPSLDRSKGGLGIGLTLVRRIVEMHGGVVLAQSEGLGMGSEFTVSLPLFVEEAVAFGHPRLRHEIRRAAVARRVLVVDDNRDAADSLAALLEMSGHQVEVAYDGIAALAVARWFEPQLVLLDIGLPGIDGYEVASRLRHEIHGKPMEIIAMTGYGQEEDKRRAIEAGFDEHLIKPVDPRMLEELIAR
jgi:PAS domain S-box-containing protein